MTKNDFKSSGFFDFDQDGNYSEEEVVAFTNAVNNTMILNYSDQSELGPYEGCVKLPQLNKSEANDFLNDSGVIPKVVIFVKLEE